MTITRRGFLQTSSLLAVGAAGQRTNRHGSASVLPSTGIVRRGAPDPHALAAAAVDAARAAGAAYADVRLTTTRTERIFGTNPSEEGESFGAGIRVLVNGAWGFASSAGWTPDEMARLARGAVTQATANATGKAHPIDLGGTPPVQHGSWSMPVRYDPFDISIGEKLDFLNDVQSYVASRMEGRPIYTEVYFRRQRKVYASTEGSSWEQTTYMSTGEFVVGYRDQYSKRLRQGRAAANFLSPAGKGWEHISESGLIDRIPELVDEAEQSRHIVPVAPNMYDVVFSAQAMSALIDATIGTATELDRAFGYEANAGGSSYLSDPLDMLGTYKVGSPLLTVTADRSTAGAAATVKWDDDSIAPDTFELVKDGVLTDFQTTREQAAWLAPYYQKHGTTARSHGCASSESGLTVTTQHAPNLRLMPGKKEVSFDDLVAGVKKGVAVLHLDTQMDQQQLNGVSYPIMRQITGGKLGPYISGAELRFRAPDLWKNLIAIGGPGSEQWTGFRRSKGEPIQETAHSVGAVPGVIQNIRIVSAQRGA